MMTPFARLATTLTLSLGIALSPITAAPARADSDADKILAILLGLAVVGTIIDDRRDRRVVVDRPHRPRTGQGPARPLPETLRDPRWCETLLGRPLPGTSLPACPPPARPLRGHHQDPQPSR